MRDSIILKKAIQIKEAQINHLETNIPRIETANKAIREKLVKANELLTLNIKNLCKYAYFFYFLNDGEELYKRVYTKSDKLHKKDIVNWKQVVKYKDINLNLEGICKNFEFFAQTEILCGKTMQMIMTTIDFPDDDVTNFLTVDFPRIAQDFFFNHNIKSIDRDSVYDYCYGAYSVAKGIEFARKSKTFNIFFPSIDFDKNEEMNTSRALYNLSCDSVSRFKGIFSKESSINTYNLFYKDRKH